MEPKSTEHVDQEMKHAQNAQIVFAKTMSPMTLKKRGDVRGLLTYTVVLFTPAESKIKSGIPERKHYH